MTKSSGAASLVLLCILAFVNPDVAVTVVLVLGAVLGAALGVVAIVKTIDWAIRARG